MQLVEQRPRPPHATFRDLRQELLHRGPQHRAEICRAVELHSEGLTGIFRSGQLSHGTLAGYMEPLLPPLRHPLLCYDNPDIYSYYLKAKRLLDLSYLVHDFGALCRQLQPDSRVVLIDMGASLDFHGSADYGESKENNPSNMPSAYLTELFAKFGFPFDHIYAYEITPTQPQDMVDAVPEHLRAAYHWINVGVDPDPESVNNPLNLIRNHFTERDIVIVKLDIDNDVIEQQLIQQLLTDARFHATNNGTQGLIDHFYFEHHLSAQFERKESIQLLTRLRDVGIPAHYWV